MWPHLSGTNYSTTVCQFLTLLLPASNSGVEGHLLIAGHIQRPCERRVARQPTLNSSPSTVSHIQPCFSRVLLPSLRPSAICRIAFFACAKSIAAVALCSGCAGSKIAEWVYRLEVIPCGGRLEVLPTCSSIHLGTSRNLLDPCVRRCD